MRDEHFEQINFIDLEHQQKIIRKEIENAIIQVLDSGNYIMGDEVRSLENDLKDFTKSNHVITCGNGTDALTAALMALNIGVGDIVFVPSFTFVATAEAPAQLGATPFFIDVDEETFNLDIQSLKNGITEAKELGLNLSAIIVVDLFGQISEIESITEIAKSEEMKVIVDAAQSFGASRNKIRTGKFGDITTTSFFPAKPLGCYGDGGAIFTDNEELSNKIKSICIHGKGNQKYDNIRIGLNSRLDTIQAAILIEKLKIFEKEIDLRNTVSESYSERLSSTDVKLPKILDTNISAWAQYTIKVKNRDRLFEFLKNNNIPSAVYYPKPLNKQGGYKHYPTVGSNCPVSERLSNEVLSLPMHPYLSDSAIDYICDKVNRSTAN